MTYCPHCDCPEVTEHDGDDGYISICRNEDCALNQTCWECGYTARQLEEEPTAFDWVCVGCLKEVA